MQEQAVMGFFDSLFGSKSPTNVEVAAERLWMSDLSSLQVNYRAIAGSLITCR